MQKMSEITQDVFFTGNLQGPRKNGFNRRQHGDVQWEHGSPLAADAHKATGCKAQQDMENPRCPPPSLLSSPVCSLTG